LTGALRQPVRFAGKAPVYLSDDLRACRLARASRQGRQAAIRPADSPFRRVKFRPSCGNTSRRSGRSPQRRTLPRPGLP